MAALFARIWLSRSVTDPVGLTVAKPFSLPIILQRLMLQRRLDIQRSLPGSARGYMSGTPHTTSDDASPTQLKGHVSYIVGTREWT